MMKATRDAYGHALVELGREMENIVVFDSDLAKSTRTNWFEEQFPSRFYNVGIAEANMVGIAAGLSATGKIPFVTTYSIFIGRAFDQIRQAVCYAKSNVKIVASHGGLSASYDGGSHQGIEDLAIMRILPGMTVLCPADYEEAKKCVVCAAKKKGPVFIRLCKEATVCFTDSKTPFEIGRAYILREGTDMAICATGTTVAEALEVAVLLEKEGISVTVVNVPTLKPLDQALFLEIAKNHPFLVTIEEHLVTGGLYSACVEFLGAAHPLPVYPIGLFDTFGQTGPWRSLMSHYGLTADKIVPVVRNLHVKGEHRAVYA